MLLLGWIRFPTNLNQDTDKLRGRHCQPCVSHGAYELRNHADIELISRWCTPSRVPQSQPPNSVCPSRLQEGPAHT